MRGCSPSFGGFGIVHREVGGWGCSEGLDEGNVSLPYSQGLVVVARGFRPVIGKSGWCGCCKIEVIRKKECVCVGGGG